MLVVALTCGCRPSAVGEATFWSTANTPLAMPVNHDLWQRTLDEFVTANDDSVNLVDYAGLAARGMPVLNDYLQQMSATDPRDYPRDVQIAYWINVYNALTLQRIAVDWPTDSILNVGGGLTGKGPWDEALITIQGRTLSLNDIEHKILRGIWQEPRIHFAVNCASIGCPDLAVSVYRGATLDAQLTAAAKGYLASARGVQIEADTLVLSSIFDWYADDFGDSTTAVTDYLESIADGPTKALLQLKYENVRYAYDWSINATP